MGPIQGQINNLLGHTAGLTALGKLKESADTAVKAVEASEEEKTKQNFKEMADAQQVRRDDIKKTAETYPGKSIISGDMQKRIAEFRKKQEVKPVSSIAKELMTKREMPERKSPSPFVSESILGKPKYKMPEQKASSVLGDIRQAKMNQMENSRVSQLKEQPIIPLSKLHGEKEDYFKLDAKLLEGRMSSQDVINAKAEQKENSITSEEDLSKTIQNNEIEELANKFGYINGDLDKNLSDEIKSQLSLLMKAEQRDFDSFDDDEKEYFMTEARDNAKKIMLNRYMDYVEDIQDKISVLEADLDIATINNQKSRLEEISNNPEVRKIVENKEEDNNEIDEIFKDDDKEGGK